jgi:hypothetical protein
LKATEKMGERKFTTRYISIEAFKYELKFDLKLYIDPTSKKMLDKATRDILESPIFFGLFDYTCAHTWITQLLPKKSILRM